MRMRNDDLLCGGGDGTLTKIRGSDLAWEIIDKVSLIGVLWFYMTFSCRFK